MITKKIRSVPVDTDWDELYFLANKFMGWSVDEFLYDYGLEFTLDLINRYIKFDLSARGVDLDEPIQKEEPKEARAVFQDLGF